MCLCLLTKELLAASLPSAPSSAKTLSLVPVFGLAFCLLYRFHSVMDFFLKVSSILYIFEGRVNQYDEALEPVLARFSLVLLCRVSAF